MGQEMLRRYSRFSWKEAKKEGEIEVDLKTILNMHTHVHVRT
jgi:hypothetical protein